MTIRTIALISAATLLAACSAAADGAKQEAAKVETATKAAAKDVMTKVAANDTPKGVSLAALPAGTYKSEQGHAYIAFKYSHNGFSNPIIRWGTTDATIVFDAANPENSKLTVKLPTDDIDTGVEVWDQHIKAEGFFDVANHPEITFTSTSIDQIKDGYGTLTGDLTIIGVTKPFTLTGTVNKIGKSRSGKDMFGISATGNLNRGDFGMTKYLAVGPDISISVEVEFQKAP